MQLLFSSSEEFGYSKGLNFVKGSVKKFKKNSKNFKIHISAGTKFKKINHSFIPKKNLDQKYYFTHSFYCEPKNKEDVHTNTLYSQENCFAPQSYVTKLLEHSFTLKKWLCWTRNYKKFKTFYMKLKTLYGLPRKVIFCKKTLISNQRPVSAIEFLHKKKTKKNFKY